MNIFVLALAIVNMPFKLDTIASKKVLPFGRDEEADKCSQSENERCRRMMHCSLWFCCVLHNRVTLYACFLVFSRIPELSPLGSASSMPHPASFFFFLPYLLALFSPLSKEVNRDGKAGKMNGVFSCTRIEEEEEEEEEGAEVEASDHDEEKRHLNFFTKYILLT